MHSTPRDQVGDKFEENICLSWHGYDSGHSTQKVLPIALSTLLKGKKPLSKSVNCFVEKNEIFQTIFHIFYVRMLSNICENQRITIVKANINVSLMENFFGFAKPLQHF